MEVSNLFVVRIIKSNRRAFYTYTFNLDLPPFVPVDRRGTDGEIPNAILRLRPERDVAEDAGEAVHILVFEIGAITPAVNLDA